MKIATIICLILSTFSATQLHAHSYLVEPTAMSSEACRVSGDRNRGERTCPGPCDLRRIERTGSVDITKIRRGIDVFIGKKPPSVPFYPPNKPATVYKRGETVTMKYTRNNHGPGGFLRISLIPLSADWMNKDVHSKHAIYYSCWGETPKVASPSELKKQKFGYNSIGSDGTQHNFEKSYYVNRVTIPDVVPDGKYIVGWAWYGGCFCKITTNGPQKPCAGNNYFGSDFMSCAFVTVKGGNKLAKSYKPVFVGSNFATPKKSGCMAAFNSLENRNEKNKCSFMRPAEFSGNGARTLTAADFIVNNVRSTSTSTPAPSKPQSKCAGDWKKCGGGNGYNGPTECCNKSFKCVKRKVTYYQCRR